MSVFRPQTIDPAPCARPAADAARPAASVPSATLVAFPGPRTRPTRRVPGSDEPRGEILLFLGVRYERLAS